MDKITDKIAAMPPDANYFSLEFFPPKTAMGFANLRSRLERMARALRPTFINVTWGAGGSTATKSLELAEICQRELGLTTCLHLTCTNMNRRLIDKTLEDAKALGVRNILALRGDPPRRDEYRDVNDSDDDWDDCEDGQFVWAIDLVKYIRKKHGDYFCIGVAAYPEGHADESHPLGQSLEHDLPYLVEKTKAGADFILTQLFFDISAYDNFERTLRQHPSGVFNTIPIIPGLMPIQNYQMIKRTTKLSHAKLPDALLDRLDTVKKDDEKVKDVGVDILAELVADVREVKSRTPGPQGFHFYTLNLEKVVSLILEKTNLIPPDSDNDDSIVGTVLAKIPLLTVNGHPNGTSTNGSHVAEKKSSFRARVNSSNGSEGRNRVIVSGKTSNPEHEVSQLEASKPAEPVHSRANTLAISEGEGVLGREATWDDYPNGRWGDARSPAYGEIDGYGVSLHVSVTQALKLWGTPTTAKDISDLFIRHLRGDLKGIPWNEEEFNPETDTIRDHLVSLNSRGWWTVASQPAVNGLRSTDATFGWGPPQGFVFQKAFVEFFLPGADWHRLHEKLQQPQLRESVWFYAANANGDFLSSDDLSAGDLTQSVQDLRQQQQSGNSLNAVTWGVFPGKEIVTPTIIEEVSFRAWAEEAFGIWGEWAKVYGRRSESEQLLEGMRRDSWLVNIIHHEYVEPEALWNLLLGASEGAVSV